MSEPPTNPSNLLDTILGEGGSVPSARLGIRALAFLLDFVLCSAIAALIIWKFALPQSHPGSYLEFNAWVEQLTVWMDSGNATSETLPKPNDALLEALRYASEIQLLTFWAYFALGEAFLAGSLGKRACRLRTINTINLGPISFFGGILRGGIKTLALFFFFPITIALNLGALFFNKRRQLGHDLLARSAVIDEKHLKIAPTEQS